MSVHWIQVAESMRSQIAAALSITVERRYTAYFDKEEVAAGKYLVIAAGAELVPKRGIDLLDLSIDFGYQRALPEATVAYPDPRNNVPWLDAEAAKVQAVLDLFAAGDELTAEGALRAADFAGATFVKWINTPVPRHDMLRDNSIYTSVIRFEFRIED